VNVYVPNLHLPEKPVKKAAKANQVQENLWPADLADPENNNHLIN
jgi:hypothetical protein